MLWCLRGVPLAIADLTKKASGILWCWHLGVEAVQALLDVLTGEVNPSAKLTQTFPKTLGQVPIDYNRYQTGRPELLSYVDGDLEPLYPFGFGLHYGCVRYEQTETEYLAATEQLIVKVRLENEGKTPIKEIVQVYFCSRYNRKLRPAKELCGFQKVLLEPGSKKDSKNRIELKEHFDCDELKNGLTLEITAGPNSREFEKTMQIKGGQAWLI